MSMAKKRHLAVGTMAMMIFLRNTIPAKLESVQVAMRPFPTQSKKNHRSKTYLDMTMMSFEAATAPAVTGVLKTSRLRVSQ